MVVIALDIGGTKIKGALVDKNLNIIKSLKIPTFASKGKKHVLDSFDIVISSLLKTKRKVTALAFSIPGLLSDDGVLLSCGNLPKTMKGVNLKKRFEKKFGIPVVTENDANCFTLAESYLGAGKEYNQVLGVIWGSGVGAGYINKKQHSVHKSMDKRETHPILLRGRDGGALELGEIPIKVGSKFVSLEEAVGGVSLTKKYSVDNISVLFEKKPKVALQVIERFAQGLATAISLFNPEIIILGGGVSNIKSKYYTLLRKRVKELTFTPEHKKNLKIVRYAISDDAGLLGVAAIALKKKL